MSAIDHVKAVFEVLNEQDGRELVRRYDDWYTPDFVWVPALTGSIDGRTYRGKDGTAEYWDDLYGSFAEMKFPSTSFELLADDVVLVLAHMRLVGHESGVSLEQDISFVCELRDGRIARMRSFLTHLDGRRAAEAAA